MCGRMDFWPYQSVPVDSLAFVQPQMHKLLGCLELVWLCHEQSLKHVTEVSNVEFVVEVRCRLPEVRSNLFERGHRAWCE